MASGVDDGGAGMLRSEIRQRHAGGPLEVYTQVFDMRNADPISDLP